MGKMQANRLGLAGEFKVMAELLLRGWNPSKSYLEDGADLTLDNGKRIEVKSAHRYKTHHSSGYCFSLRGGRRKQIIGLPNCDFLVCWCIDDDCFYIIPKTELTATALAIYNTSANARHKYTAYKDNWDILK